MWDWQKSKCHERPEPKTQQPEIKIIKNKCPKCGIVSEYVDNIKNTLEDNDNVVIGLTCKHCQYHCDIVYKQKIK